MRCNALENKKINYKPTLETILAGTILAVTAVLFIKHYEPQKPKYEQPAPVSSNAYISSISE